MIFAVIFQDNPSADPEIRTHHMQAHLAFLKTNASNIKAAGPLVKSADDQASGGLWIVEAETYHQVDTLVTNDPFWPTGLRQDYQICHWRKVYENGAQLTGV